MQNRACVSIAFLVFSVLLLSMASGVRAAREGVPIELTTLERDDIVVRFERPLANAAREIVRLFPSAKDELAKLLQWEIRFRPEVILIRDSRTFRMLTRTDAYVAFAEPERELIVIDYSRMESHPFDLYVTFKHELCHLLLHACIPVGLPKWFDEGVSQWVTGGLAEIVTDDKRSVLKEAALAGELFRFRDLSDGFPEDPHGLTLAYEQSRSLVQYIAETYGTFRLQQVLTALEHGSTMDDAIHNNLGLSMRDLERVWVSLQTERLEWLVYLSNNLYEILFLFASLMTIIAVAKTIARKLTRRNRRGEDDEERE